MLMIRDLMGNEEALTDFKELTLIRRVNGEKQLSLTLFPTAHNEHSFPMVEEESVLTFKNEEYVIKQVSERSIGNTYIKRVEAIHKFYVDMINKQQPNIHNGSMTFDAYLQFVFNGTGYTFSIIDPFYSRDFENLGDGNRLALLQKGLERYKAEMEIVGTNVRFLNKVGNDTDFQFRYGHNIKAIEKYVDTTNLATVIRGKWEDGMTLEYRSPNVDIFGEIDAPLFTDERYTSKITRLQAMEESIEDTPEFSITIDFVDLRAAGYPYTVPNEGDRVHVIYEPMNDLLIENRIMEIKEVYNAKFEVIKSDVTLSNYKKTFAGTMFDNVDKRLKDIIGDNGRIKYNVMDEAVKIATEALKSAQTELEFNNGIIARDKNNPNLLVLFNSGGVGISTDGGNTFRQAITSQGIVTDLLTAGAVRTNNIKIIGQDNYFYWDGGQLIAIDPNNTNKFARLKAGELYLSRGAMVVERPDGYKTINNGIPQNDFAIIGAEPPYTESGVSVSGFFWATTSTTPKSCQYYSFKHDARYLKLDVALYAGSETAGSRVTVYRSTNTLLAEKVTYSTDPNSNLAVIGETLTIDLGTPTGAITGIYVRLNSGDEWGTAYGRVLRIWKEG